MFEGYLPLFTAYVALYSSAVACAIAITWQDEAFAPRALLLALSLFLFSLGFPPSPLFVAKIALGSSVATFWGVVTSTALCLILLAAWARFVQLCLSVMMPAKFKYRTTQGQRRRVAIVLSVTLVILVVAISCTPFGLAVICAI